MTDFETGTKPTFFDKLWHKYLRCPYILHAYDHGRPKSNSPIIILLHGLASSSANWDPLIPLLKENYRCITIDLAGFGDSPKPQWYRYTMDEHIRNIRRTIASFKLEQEFILAGHSLGSLLATRYARQYPRQVQRLILLSPPVYAPLGTIESRSARQRTSMYLKAYQYIRTNKRVTPENFMRLSRMIPAMKFLVINRATWIPMLRSLEHCIEQQTIIDDIVAVKAPIDIFYGIFDEVVVPYNVQKLAKIREVTLHPLKVQHAVGKRYAEAVARVLNSLGNETNNHKNSVGRPRQPLT